MPTKTITIMDDAYELLASNKRKGESFSDLIRRTFKKSEFSYFAGIFEDMDKKDVLKIENLTKKQRNYSSIEFLKEANNIK